MLLPRIKDWTTLYPFQSLTKTYPGLKFRRTNRNWDAKAMWHMAQIWTWCRKLDKRTLLLTKVWIARQLRPLKTKSSGPQQWLLGRKKLLCIPKDSPTLEERQPSHPIEGTRCICRTYMRTNTTSPTWIQSMRTGFTSRRFTTNLLCPITQACKWTSWKT